MSELEKEKQIIETFERILPLLSESKKSYLLGLGEGMAMSHQREEKKQEKKEYQPA